MKLYEITGKALQLLDGLRETGGELTPELAGLVDTIETELPIRAQSICYLITQMESDAEAIDAEIDRLKKLRDPMANGAKRLKDYLKRAMEQMGIKHIDVPSPLFKPRIVGNGGNPSVKWRGVPEEIPSAYRKKQPIELDTAKVLLDHKAGVDLPAQVEITRGTNLKIS